MEVLNNNSSNNLFYLIVVKVLKHPHLADKSTVFFIIKLVDGFQSILKYQPIKDP